MQKIKQTLKSFVDFITEAQMRRAERVLACYKKNGSLGRWR
jgi:hypothetical protein